MRPPYAALRARLAAAILRLAGHGTMRARRAEELAAQLLADPDVRAVFGEVVEPRLREHQLEQLLAALVRALPRRSEFTSPALEAAATQAADYLWPPRSVA